MTEYTPGPWRWDGSFLHSYDGPFILRVSVDPKLADARLIAAAPDLYEAAKAFVAINECACPTPQDMPFDEELPAFPEWIKTNRCYWHKARAAIAAAEGVE